MLGLLEWPASIKPSTVSSVPSSTLDYYPTTLNVLGLMPERQPQSTDGISLLPLIQGKMVQRPVPIPFETLGTIDTNASRGSPKMALVDNLSNSLTDMEQNSKPLLFDLVNDPGESTNLAKELTERVATMKMALEQVQNSCMRSLAGKDYAEEFTPDKHEVHPSTTRASIKKNKRSTVLPSIESSEAC